MDLQAYYSGLLITQYRQKTKAIDTIKALVNCALCDDLPLALQRCFDLETAAGAQLDIIGRIVGVNREVYGLDLAHTFFELTTYSGTPVGIDLAGYADSPVTTDIMLRYNGQATYNMTDFEYRAVIKLKIVYNFTYASLKDIIEALWVFFGTNISLSESALMEFTFTAVNTVYKTPLLVAKYLNILPRPMAVNAVVA